MINTEVQSVLWFIMARDLPGRKQILVVNMMVQNVHLYILSCHIHYKNTEISKLVIIYFFLKIVIIKKPWL